MSLLGIRLPEIIGFTILHSLWQITLLWIILVAVLRLCPKASSAVRYAFAISILILSVLTIAATAVYEWQLHATDEEIALPNVTIQTMNSVDIAVTQTLLSRIVDVLNASVPTLAWFWCAGLVVMGARFSGSFFYLRTLRAQDNIAAISPVWEQELKRLSVALGLQCEVAIATSARISSPLTLGSISPIILLPAGLLSGMSTSQIEAILVHELYHIKRHDYIINICQALIEVLLFYHPALWHINKIIREERENCCDDQTLAFCGDAITYARALTQLQEINTLPKPTLAMSATEPNAGNFSSRIKRLFNVYPNPAHARSKGILAIGFLIVYLGMVLAGANISTAHPVEPEKTPMKTSVNDTNTFNNIFSDSMRVSDHLYILDEKESTPQPAASEKIRSIDIQHADTSVVEQSLDKCLQQVKLILAMASIHRLPSERFKFSAEDPLWSGALELQPIRFYRTANLSRITRLGLIDTTDNETSKEQLIEEFTKGVAVQVFPNSTNGRLNISFTPAHNNSRVTLVLVDSDGKVAKEITDSTYDTNLIELHLDVSSYKKGIYILQINIDGVTSQQRVIVE